MRSSRDHQGRVERGSILVVDDEVEMCRLLETLLGKRGFQVYSAASSEQALEELGRHDIDVVVTDLNLKGSSGTELCQTVAERWPDVPVIVLTAYGSLETAIGAIRAGAYDFITKPLKAEVLQMALERALLHLRTRTELKHLRSARSQTPLPAVVGQSEPMRRIYETVHRVAETDTSVLLTGESGTGKELVARAIHDASRRAGGPFVAINCAALPESLLESELFGYEKGAFTDARHAHAGLFVQAERGTLFLDEIGDMPLALQPKLLRVLQERKLRPVGGQRELAVDFRIVAATHQDLEERVAKSLFREDLYYRIAVVTLDLPPLRARGHDVLLLAQHFIRHFSAQMRRSVSELSPAAAEKLLAYDFPGNVRELQNAMERAVALTAHERVEVEDLPEAIATGRPSSRVKQQPELISLEELERRHILGVLDHLGGNKTLAAEVLGVDRKTLSRKLSAWATQPSATRVSGSK